MGSAGPSWLTREGIVIPCHADRELVALAERLFAEHPEWGAYAVRLKGGNTEMADALRASAPPAITVSGQGPRGEMPYGHQVDVTVDKLDPESMGRANSPIWAFVQALDAQAASR